MTIAGELHILRDSVAQNRGDDFVNYLDLSPYVRQNKAIDLTPRRPQAALVPASTQVIAAISRRGGLVCGCSRPGSHNMAENQNRKKWHWFNSRLTADDESLGHFLSVP